MLFKRTWDEKASRVDGSNSGGEENRRKFKAAAKTGEENLAIVCNKNLM